MVNTNMRWGGTSYVTHLEEKTDAQNILVGKPEGKRPPGRPRCRWVNNMKIDLKEIGHGGYESQSTEVRDPMAELRTEGPKI
jgi:hypothetical protein